VRLLASILREDGRTVLAKTTGSQACYILPDGEEESVKRFGPASIMEQKRLLKKAVACKAEILVAEVMSIHPENHFIESNKLLKPHIIAVTNVRKDHTCAMGENVQDIASVLALDITENSQVFCADHECSGIFETAAKEKNAAYHHVKSFQNSSGFFPENMALIRQIALSLDIKNEIIEKGIQKVKNDIGMLKAWKIKSGYKDAFFVNAFAANDPQSTYEVFRIIKERMPFVEHWTGLFAVRADKGDRSLQWIEELKGDLKIFEKLIVTGDSRRAVARNLPGTEVTKNNNPQKITEQLLKTISPNGSVFGFGNIGGTGKLLVQHWQNIGQEYGL